jgi:hypothetical protein
MRLSDFAYAVGVTPKAARQWLEGGSAFAHVRRIPGAWAEFDNNDVAYGAMMVAIMRALNLSVKDAVAIIDRVLRPGRRKRLILDFGKAGVFEAVPPPERKPIDLFGGKLMVLVRGPVEWHIGLISKNMKLGEMEGGPVRVVIDADAIVNAALTRSAERAEARAFLARKANKKAA